MKDQRVSAASHWTAPPSLARVLGGGAIDLSVGLLLALAVARMQRPAAVDVVDFLVFSGSYTAFWIVSLGLHCLTTSPPGPRVIITALCSVSASALTQVFVAPLLSPMMRGVVAALAAAALPPVCTAIRLRFSEVSPGTGGRTLGLLVLNRCCGWRLQA
jgi:hypothetical protein